MTLAKLGQHSLICLGCWEQQRMPVFIRGPLAVPYRMLGLVPSRMNPNLCTRCEIGFASIYKTKQIRRPLTILFADVRGYTRFSQLVDAPEVAKVLSGFYEACGEEIWMREGIVNKLIGDAVLGVFNFPLAREDHVARAASAGMALLEKCREVKLSLGEQVAAEAIGVGVGIHTGEASIGEVGEFCRDFTVIGPVVNLASRLQGAAHAGEVLLSDAAYRAAAPAFPHAERRELTLKGHDHPVTAWALKPSSTPVTQT